jgi:hypothetical protein
MNDEFLKVENSDTRLFFAVQRWHDEDNFIVDWSPNGSEQNLSSSKTDTAGDLRKIET